MTNADEINEKIKETLEWLNSLTEEEKKKFYESCSRPVIEEEIRKQEEEARLRYLEEERQWYKQIETPQTEVEVVNKTIIITDPCYVSDGECEDFRYDFEPYIVKNTLYGDWSCNVYKGSKEEVTDIMQAWDEFYIPWWKARNREDLTPEEKETLDEEYKKKSAEYEEKYLIGQFCADAGMVAVYDADKIPPEKLQWCKEHDWCACIIENYTGPIRYEVEEIIDPESGYKSREAHIAGKNFYSSQSGF